MMALALAAAAAVQEPPERPRIVSRAYRPTVESLTEPNRELDCRLADRARRWTPLRLRMVGNRGYRTAQGVVQARGRNVHVTADPAGLLEGLPIWTVHDGNMLFGSERGRSIVFWSVAPPPVYSTVVLVPRGPGMERRAGDPSWAGFCTVTETQQVPLTDDEARREGLR
jgi:hypothetical protein